LYIDRPVSELRVSVTGKVLTDDRAGMIQGLPGDLPPPVFLRETPHTHAGDDLQTLTHALQRQGGAQLDMLHRLNAHIHMR
ncbi:hypothetical protein ACDX35_24370, partial [Enterobacter hormaechei]|uniref:hypothetical protein n=1 Tax=Enterobacter hormaechei TaxID=158836 RepID=UPI0039C2EDDD